MVKYSKLSVSFTIIIINRMELGCGSGAWKRFIL